MTGVAARLTIQTPTGRFTLTEEGGAITRAEWGGQAVDESPLLREAARQLAGYFQGELTRFDLPLAPGGSDTRRRFLAVLQEIPFGDTRTYGELAAQIGMSPQAAGQLCGSNPIPVIIPCHRVLGSNSLGGFSAPGGVDTKVWLLRHEGAAGLLI